MLSTPGYLSSEKELGGFLNSKGRNNLEEPDLS